MTGLGIQAWGLSLNGLRIGFWHGHVMQLLEVLRILDHSYRLSSIGGSSDVVIGRFTLRFGRTVVAVALCKLAWRKSCLLQAREVVSYARRAYRD